MLGWLSIAAERISRWNRSSAPGLSSSPLLTTFSTSSRSRMRLRARYTTPMPPRPSSLISS